ncbi:MAG TPA: molybdopterin dinucleotide binding domain-containing protein, partial [Pirellulales bacterium]|nr:molybdopterin dinucleotide binding domain-containing protein [Pirellulales bacterium]
HRYAAARRVVFSWTMGITHHLHGVANVQAIANLALMRGMVGRQGAGLLPIRGHSNVQGIGSVGVSPKLKDAVFERLERHFGIRLPVTPGLDTMACVEAADEEKVKFALCLGGNLYGSNPDSTFASRALGKLDMIVYLSTTLNTGHAHGLARETIILPVLARDEEPAATTQESMFSYVRLSDGGPPRHIGPRSEIQIVAELARRILPTDGPFNWNRLAENCQIREAIAAVIPGWEKIDQIDRTKAEFEIAGRHLTTPCFSTSSGRGRLHAHDLPPLAGDGGQLRLMTVRSEGQFNTVVYEDYDLYRGQDSRNVVLVHPDDLARLNLAAEARVRVRSEVGQLDNVVIKAYAKIRPGNALMYYPEANQLVPRHVDPQSRTPAFKNVLVAIEGSTIPPILNGDAPTTASGRATEAALAASRANMRAC